MNQETLKLIETKTRAGAGGTGGAPITAHGELFVQAGQGNCTCRSALLSSQKPAPRCPPLGVVKFHYTGFGQAGDLAVYLRKFRQKGREYSYILRSERNGKDVEQERVATVTGMCGLFDRENQRYLFFHPLPCRSTHCVRCPLESVPHPQTNAGKISLAERLRDLPRFQRDTWLPHCYRRRGTIREEGGVRNWRLSSTDPAVDDPRPSQ